MRKIIALIGLLVASPIFVFGCGAEPLADIEASAMDEIPALDTEGVCTAVVNCGDGTTRGCAGNSYCSTSADGCDGWVTCDGNTTYCPPCPPPVCVYNGVTYPSGSIIYSGFCSAVYPKKGICKAAGPCSGMPCQSDYVCKYICEDGQLGCGIW